MASDSDNRDSGGTTASVADYTDSNKNEAGKDPSGPS